MNLKFTDSFENLKGLLQALNGTWEDSGDNKKVFRWGDGIMNWFPSTGTLQFQGKEAGRRALETHVNAKLNPSLAVAIDSAIAREIPAAKHPEQRTEGMPLPTPEELYLDRRFDDSELVFGIVSPVGTESNFVITPLTDRLRGFKYTVVEIKVSSLLGPPAGGGEYNRIKSLINKGDTVRAKADDNSVLAYGVAKLIKEKRSTLSGEKRVAYIISSLKRPEEAEQLRRIYGPGFYLVGIHSDEKRRINFLKNERQMDETQATELVKLDEDEKFPAGQRTRDTFHLSDLFLNAEKHPDHVKHSIQRFLSLIFGDPYKNPTFDEFAMFMAFSSSVRSGDLSRQVGAVLVKERQIISTGANECPQFGGGLYWAELDELTGEVKDRPDGKDYTRTEDSNKAEQTSIIEGIMTDVVKNIPNLAPQSTEKLEEILTASRISDLTEFGRVVHAEMEALLACARSGQSSAGTTLYCTTFPCHNCAKHIIAGGVTKVVYVEPYPKSKALDFHSESIVLKTEENASQLSGKVVFEPFIGVGARRFLDFFSMSLGSGGKLKRKDGDGNIVEWEAGTASLRVPLLPKSYRDVEKAAAEQFVNKLTI